MVLKKVAVSFSSGRFVGYLVGREEPLDELLVNILSYFLKKLNYNSLEILALESLVCPSNTKSVKMMLVADSWIWPSKFKAAFDKN